MRTLPLVALVVLPLLAGACTSSQGPFVRDVYVAPGGQMMVERCYLKLTHYGPLIDAMPEGMSFHDCTTTPAASSAAP